MLLFLILFLPLFAAPIQISDGISTHCQKIAQAAQILDDQGNYLKTEAEWLDKDAQNILRYEYPGILLRYLQASQEGRHVLADWLSHSWSKDVRNRFNKTRDPMTNNEYVQHLRKVFPPHLVDLLSGLTIQEQQAWVRLLRSEPDYNDLKQIFKAHANKYPIPEVALQKKIVFEFARYFHVQKELTEIQQADGTIDRSKLLEGSRLKPIPPGGIPFHFNKAILESGLVEKTQIPADQVLRLNFTIVESSTGTLQMFLAPVIDNRSPMNYSKGLPWPTAKHTLLTQGEPAYLSGELVLTSAGEIAAASFFSGHYERPRAEKIEKELTNLDLEKREPVKDELKEIQKQTLLKAFTKLNLKTAPDIKIYVEISEEVPEVHKLFGNPIP